MYDGQKLLTNCIHCLNYTDIVSTMVHVVRTTAKAETIPYRGSRYNQSSRGLHRGSKIDMATIINRIMQAAKKAPKHRSRGENILPTSNDEKYESLSNAPNIVSKITIQGDGRVGTISSLSSSCSSDRSSCSAFSSVLWIDSYVYVLHISCVDARCNWASVFARLLRFNQCRRHSTNEMIQHTADATGPRITSDGDFTSSLSLWFVAVVASTLRCNPATTTTQPNTKDSSVKAKRDPWIMRVRVGSDGEVYGTSQIAFLAVAGATIHAAPADFVSSDAIIRCHDYEAWIVFITKIRDKSKIASRVWSVVQCRKC